jgi:tRNA A-37 threonylcarbamoyl transferase component Bud32
MNNNNSGARITSFVFFGLCVLFFILAWAAGSGWAVMFYISLAGGLIALAVDYNNKKKASSPVEEKTSPPWVPPVVPPPPPTIITDPDPLTPMPKLIKTERDAFNETLGKAPNAPSAPPPPPPPPVAPPRPKGLINGRYELVKKLKDGGMAEVYLVKDWDNGQKQVVIKKPRSDTDHSTELNVDKLRQEADYLRKANHPNIVKFLDLFQDEGRLPNLVEDYVNGGDLLTRFRSSPADEQSAVRWAVQILDALEYIHNSGFIHRDLNPGNIMANQNNNITLIDFGTVKSSGFSSDTVFFKPGFVIPEVAAKGYADTRSDIYGVGGTLYYMLTCDRPGFIKDRDVVAILAAKGITQRTAKCVDQALQLDPNFRFQRAEAMRRALTGG